VLDTMKQVRRLGAVVDREALQSIAQRTLEHCRPEAEPIAVSSAWARSFKRRKGLMNRSITSVRPVSSPAEVKLDNCWRRHYEEVCPAGL
jgi:hypothetical protein